MMVLPQSARRLFIPLRIRDFRFLWLSKSVSAAEGAIRTIALVWLVLEITGSSVALSGALLALAIPQIALLLLGGTITDRYNPRIVMFCCKIVQACIALSIATLATFDLLSLPVLYGLLGIVGVIGGIYSPATQSIVPKLVPSDKLQAANSLEQLSPQMVFIIGAPVGGGLVAWLGPVPAFALNSLFLAISAYFVYRISPMKSEIAEADAAKKGLSLIKDAFSGLKYVSGRPWMFGLTATDALCNFAFAGPFMVALPILAKHQASFGSEGYGWLLAAFSGGTLIGLLAAGMMNGPKKYGIPLCVLGLVQVPFIFGLVLSSLPFAMFCLAMIGIFNGIAGIVYTILIQKKTDSQMLGRVMSIVTLSQMGLQPVSQLVTGILMEASGAEMIFIFAGILIFAASLGSLLIPSVRRV